MTEGAGQAEWLGRWPEHALPWKLTQDLQMESLQGEGVTLTLCSGWLRQDRRAAPLVLQGQLSEAVTVPAAPFHEMCLPTSVDGHSAPRRPGAERDW